MDVVTGRHTVSSVQRSVEGECAGSERDQIERHGAVSQDWSAQDESGFSPRESAQIHERSGACIRSSAQDIGGASRVIDPTNETRSALPTAENKKMKRPEPLMTQSTAAHGISSGAPGADSSPSKRDVGLCPPSSGGLVSVHECGLEQRCVEGMKNLYKKIGPCLAALGQVRH